MFTLFPFHVPICSLKHLRESNRRNIKYLTGSRHRTEAGPCCSRRWTFLFSNAWYVTLAGGQKPVTSRSWSSFLNNKTTNDLFQILWIVPLICSASSLMLIAQTGFPVHCTCLSLKSLLWRAICFHDEVLFGDPLLIWEVLELKIYVWSSLFPSLYPESPIGVKADEQFLCSCPVFCAWVF